MENKSETGKEESTPKESAEIHLLTWNSRIKVLFNPSAWRGVSLAFGVGAVLLAILFSAITQSMAGFYLGAGLFAGFMVIFLIVACFIDLFGGFHARFTLTSLGVHSQSGKGAKAAADAAVLVGALSGNLSAMGAGKLARAEQDVFIPFESITKVRANTKRRSILIKGSWWDKPINLVCDENNFDEVIRILKVNCHSAMIIGHGV